jgi:hypothetical protein
MPGAIHSLPQYDFRRDAGKKENRGTFLHLHLVNVMIMRDLVTCVTLMSFVH